VNKFFSVTILCVPAGHCAGGYVQSVYGMDAMNVCLRCGLAVSSQPTSTTLVPQKPSEPRTALSSEHRICAVSAVVACNGIDDGPSGNCATGRRYRTMRQSGAHLEVRGREPSDARSALANAHRSSSPWATPSPVDADDSRGRKTGLSRYPAAAYRKCLEVCLPLESGSVNAGDLLKLQVSLWHEGLPVDSLPSQGWLDCPTADPPD
jgi:hypothetical protein